jgi:phosphonate transport system substrate-binding protein
LQRLALWLALPGLAPHDPAEPIGGDGLRALLRGSVARLIALSGLLVLLLAAGIRPAIGADPLVFGVFPNMTPKQIVENYRPLTNALEKGLQRRVVVYSARDFKTFVERTRAGEYDILLTAPHLAWLARQDVGYRPLLKYTQPVRGLLVVKADSPFYAPEALRGHTIATADTLAVAVLAMQTELTAYGLRHNIDYFTTDAGTHTNAVTQLMNGRTDAAMLGLHPFLLLPPDQRQQLRVLAETPPLSSLMFLTHPRMRDREAMAVRSALLDFSATPEGHTFMKKGGYGGFTPVDGNELHAFRPYALQVQDMLRAPR